MMQTAHVLPRGSASEMTYIVSSGALNSTHSLTLPRGTKDAILVESVC